MQKFKVSALLSAFSLLFLLGFALTWHFTSFAQETSDEEGTPVTTQDPTIQAAIATHYAEYDERRNSRTIFDFSVAYLIKNDAVDSNNLISSETFHQFFGADIFDTWEAFAIANEEAPYQIVIIHTSLFDQIDLEWTHWAYKNRVILFGISMPFSQIAAITGDQCIEEFNKGILEEYGATYTNYRYFVKLEDESYRTQIDERKLIYCDEQFEVNGTEAMISKGRTNLGITRIEDLTAIMNKMLTITMTYELEPNPNRGFIPLPTAIQTSIATP